MYLTAQRVQRADGEHEVHAYLHAHDSDAHPFPERAADVALKAPGRLVAAWPLEADCRIAPGGNDVVSYIDIAADDRHWSRRWLDNLVRVDICIDPAKPLQAWTVGPLYVEFYVAAKDSSVTPEAEFRLLRQACARLISPETEGSK